MYQQVAPIEIYVKKHNKNNNNNTLLAVNKQPFLCV